MATPKTSARRPSRREAAVLFEAIDRPQLALLYKTLPVVADPLTVEDVAKLAVFDWLCHHHALSDADRLRLVLEMAAALGDFAGQFEREALAGDGHTPATLAILDFRFAIVRVGGIPPARPLPFYDLDADARLDALPHHVLTSLAVDLNVLLLRLFGRLEKVRRLQEQQDAAARPAAFDGTARSGPENLDP